MNANAKRSISLFLLLYLTGCSWRVPVEIYQKLSEGRIRIASDIPASNIPCVPQQTGQESELSTRTQVATELTTNFRSGNFAKLEKSYNDYRQSTSRTPSGIWKLSFFYRGTDFKKLYNAKDEESWKKAERQALRWIDTYPTSPAPYIFHSQLLIARAFDFRGTKFSREVTPEAWEPFRQNVEMARTVLVNHKDFASTDPEWYATMMQIAKLQGWSKQEVKDLLHEALSKEPYYHDTYFGAFSYSLPNKWRRGRGSYAETEQFVTDAMAITRKCEGSGMYARLYRRGIRENSEFTEKSSDPGLVSWKKMKNVNWEKMSQGFEDIIVRYPDDWTLNSYAKFACLARDKAKAKELFKKIKGRTIEKPWTDYPPVNPLGCQKWVIEP
jgi:hypothetical protein